MKTSVEVRHINSKAMKYGHLKSKHHAKQDQATTQKKRMKTAAKDYTAQSNSYATDIFITKIV